MLVDVVELRRGGARRSIEEVKAARPVRGWLTLDPSRPGWHSGQRNAPMLASLLIPGTCEWAIEPLDHARVVKIARGAMLMVGLQERSRPVRLVEQVRQAWWVRAATP